MQASETPPDQEAARDILAAEEFAMPAAQARRPSGGPLAPVTQSPWRIGLGALGALLAVLRLRRRGR